MRIIRSVQIHCVRPVQNFVQIWTLNQSSENLCGVWGCGQVLATCHCTVFFNSLSVQFASRLEAWQFNSSGLYSGWRHTLRLTRIINHIFLKVISSVELAVFLVTWITNALLIIQLLRLTKWFRRCGVIFIEAKRSMDRLRLNKQAQVYVV